MKTKRDSCIEKIKQGEMYNFDELLHNLLRDIFLANLTVEEIQSIRKKVEEIIGNNT